MNDTDLIIGAELLEDNIQMCVYDSELKAPVAADTEKDKTLSENIKAVINKKNASSVASICVVVPDFTKDTLEIVKEELYNAGVANEQYQIISRIESFAYYAYRQKSELHAAGVALFDYTSEGIRCDYLAVRKNDNSNYLLQEHTGYTSDILKEAVISKELGLAENELCTFTEEYFSKRHVSAAYLTGEGFDVEKLPERKEIHELGIYRKISAYV